MKIILAALAALALTGCATCERHPVACTIGGAFIAGSIVATVEAHHGHTNGAPDLCHAVGPDGRATGVIGACVNHGQ